MKRCDISGACFADFDKWRGKNSRCGAGMNGLAEVASAAKNVIMWVELIKGMIALAQKGSDAFPQMVREDFDLLMPDLTIARGKFM